MGSLEIGPCSPEVFEAGKRDRVPEGELSMDALYSWFSLHGPTASVYPSRIHHISHDKPEGLPTVRFSILNPNLEEILVSYSHFLGGLYWGQKGSAPLTKQETYGSVVVEDGYFQGPIVVDPASLCRGMHGRHPAAQALVRA